MTTVSGMNFANAKRICKILFGDDLFKIYQNENNYSFEIYLKKNLEKDIKKLKSEYPNFEFFLVTITPIK